MSLGTEVRVWFIIWNDVTVQKSGMPATSLQGCNDIIREKCAYVHYYFYFFLKIIINCVGIHSISSTSPRLLMWLGSQESYQLELLWTSEGP